MTSGSPHRPVENGVNREAYIVTFVISWCCMDDTVTQLQYELIVPDLNTSVFQQEMIDTTMLIPVVFL